MYVADTGTFGIQNPRRSSTGGEDPWQVLWTREGFCPA